MLPAIGLLTLLWVNPAAAQEQTSAGTDSALVTQPGAKLDWNAVTPKGWDTGMEMTVVRGDPTAAKEPYVLRLRFPDGYQFPPHWHPVPENLTVLEGTFVLGMGETRDESRLRRYAPGDFMYIQPEHPHFGGANGRTVVQLHGPGPFEIITVGSLDDARRQRISSAN